MKKTRGILVVSIDFELHWGVRDKRSVTEYGQNILGGRRAIPLLLDLFRRYGIHATWATVGFLFFRNKRDLLKNCPVLQPTYLNRKRSPYTNIDEIGRDEKEDPYHFAPSLLKLIRSYPNQEIGTHTFSHYYCLEAGQTPEAFAADIAAAVAAADTLGLKLRSAVFPRNQSSSAYLKVCQQHGIRAFRGNELSFMYRPRNEEEENLITRFLRIIDTYVNISGHNTYSLVPSSGPINIRSSRFLRPYMRPLRILEPLRLNRILSCMTHAAKTGQVYHLWWHPHNFGTNMDKSIGFLTKILKHYSYLKRVYRMESLNMGEIAEGLVS